MHRLLDDVQNKDTKCVILFWNLHFLFYYILNIYKVIFILGFPKKVMHLCKDIIKYITFGVTLYTWDKQIVFKYQLR